ncbi:hypothetical protein D3C81_1305270 [compost metagenome]
MERAGGVQWADRHGFAGEHGARVEPFVHLHQRDAGLGVAGLDGAVDRGRAAPARQQRGVDVQAPIARQGQHLGRQDQAVGGHHHDIGRRGRQRIDSRAGFLGILALAAQRARLEHEPQAGIEGELLDRARLQLHAAARRAVRLGQHGHHRKACGVDGLQGDAREFRGAGKGNAQWLGLGHGRVPR